MKRPRPVPSRRSFVLVLPLLLAVVAAGRASAAATPAAANLLTNPSAEEGTLLAPTDWDSSRTQVPTARFAWDSEQAHDGKRSLYIINTGNVIPVWFNWSQTLTGVSNLAGKELTLRAWVKTRNLSGKAYLLLQAYRDTVLLEAMKQGVPRQRMRDLMHIKPADDPQLEMGWARKQLSGDHDDWTPLEVKVFVPPSTNMVFVRGGIFGVGEVWFDDFSLTASPAAPEKPFPLAKNLLVDPGFEDHLDQWELSLPPLEGLRVDLDGQVVHGGSQSVRLESQRHPPYQLFSHVCQVFNTRALSGKHVRMTGWVKTDHLDQGSAFLTVVATGKYGSFRPVIPDGVSGTKDWTFVTYECDIPRDTYTVWARAAFTTSEGRVWFDDVSFEVLGDAKTASAKESASRKKS